MARRIAGSCGRSRCDALLLFLPSPESLAKRGTCEDQSSGNVVHTLFVRKIALRPGCLGAVHEATQGRP